MKKIYLLCFMMSLKFYAQIDSLKVQDLEIPNSPALTILDKSFSLIETENTSNIINANSVNISDNSIEIVPYWLITKGKFASSGEYFGFTTVNDTIIKQKIFNDLKKASISAAYAKSDINSSIAFGIKANIISIRSVKEIVENFKLYKKYVKKRDDFVKTNMPVKLLNPAKSDKARDSLINLYDRNNKSEKDKIVNDIYYFHNHRKFTLDAAIGFSEQFLENQVDNARIGRYGVWTTEKYSFILNNDRDLMNLYVYGRFLNDETLTDDNNEFIKQSFIDIGGKLEFQIKRFAVSAEYINRNGDNKNYRLTGNLQYNLLENLYLTAAYGKNYDNPSGNLITLFGLKWGLSKNATVKLDNM